MSDFYEEEFAREARQSRQDRDKRRSTHGPSGESARAGSAPAPDAAPLDTADVATLREALAAERRNRAWVESRLEELEQRLRRAQAAERTLQTSGAQDQVSILGLAVGHPQELQKVADREALESWILEAQIRADAAEPQALVVTKQEPIVTVAEPVVVRETVVVREAYVDPHFEEKLASARLAVQAAEARAEHNAAQVRRLTEELAAARAEQMRAANRLREIEQRLHGVEARAELLDSLVAPKSPEHGAPEFELPADSMAPLAPEKPGLVYTETELGMQLSPAQPAGETSEPLSLEDFEPRPAPPTVAEVPDPVPAAESLSLESPFEESPFNSEAAPEAPTPETANETSLVDALSELFGAKAAAASAPKEESAPDDLEGALESWGSRGTAAPAPREGVAGMAQPEPLYVEDEDPFGGLASALESFGSAPAPPTQQVQEATAEDEAEFAASEALEVVESSLEAEPEVEAAAIPEEPAAPQVPAEEAPAGGDLLAALGRAEAERRAQRPRPPQRDRGAAVVNALESWSGGEAEDANGGTDASTGGDSKPPVKGRAAMVDALLKFMGPQ